MTPARLMASLVAMALLFCWTTAPTYAQWFSNAALNAINLDVQGSAIRGQVFSQNISNVIASIQPIAVLAGKNKLIYRPSRAVRKRNFAQFVAKTRAIDPSGAKKLEQFFAKNDVMGQINQAMAPIGLRSDNAADAYAVYWTTAWLGSRGRDDDLPNSQMIAVRDQVANALLATPEFVAATDAQKQEMSEALLIHAALIAAFIESSGSDPELRVQVKGAIIQGAKGMGLDLAQMDLTPQGFRSIN